MSALETMMPAPQVADLGDVKLAYYEAGPHQGVHRNAGSKARDIAARAGDIGFEVIGDQSRLTLDAIEHTGNDDLFDASIVQPADSRNRDRDQCDHCDGQFSGERHPCFASSPRRHDTRIAEAGNMLGIRDRKQHRAL